MSIVHRLSHTSTSPTVRPGDWPSIVAMNRAILDAVEAGVRAFRDHLSSVVELVREGQEAPVPPPRPGRGRLSGIAALDEDVDVDVVSAVTGAVG